LSERNKAIVRRQEEELCIRGNLDAATELDTSDYVGHDPSNPPEKGHSPLPIDAPDGYVPHSPPLDIIDRCELWEVGARPIVLWREARAHQPCAAV
jgi:hypothetical protein